VTDSRRPDLTEAFDPGIFGQFAIQAAYLALLGWNASLLLIM
jgi:hypothetical protein